MSGTGGIYKGPGGQELYGDGREVSPVSKPANPPPPTVGERRVTQSKTRNGGWLVVEGRADSGDGTSYEVAVASVLLESDALLLAHGRARIKRLEKLLRRVADQVVWSPAIECTADLETLKYRAALKKEVAAALAAVDPK